MSSPKKVRANQENGKKGKGPITARGKEIVAKNALKEGLFSAALYIPEEDRSRYDQLYRALNLQLEPATAIQQLIFESIVTAAWRHVLALRRETRRFEESFATKTDAIPAPSDPPTQTEWYGTNITAYKVAERQLQLAKHQLEHGGYIDSGLMKNLEGAFGADFVRELERWHSSDLTHLHAVQMMRHKAELYRRQFEEKTEPEGDDEVGDENVVHTDEPAGRSAWEEPEDPQIKVVVDPTERVHMRIKIIDLQLSHLRDMRHIFDSIADHQARGFYGAAAEPPYRYVNSTLKELMRATDYYREIKKKGL